MAVTLPAQIAVYFSAKDATDFNMLGSCLAPDVHVWDRGEDTEIRGIDNVKKWMEETNKKYTLSTEIAASQINGDTVIVNTVVSGDFPGSPLPFTYRFSLANAKIAAIDIIPSE
jgi:hypothetical protein